MLNYQKFYSSAYLWPTNKIIDSWQG